MNRNLLELPESPEKLDTFKEERQPGADSYEQRAVVFLDILGFKELVNKSKHKAELISKLAEVLGSSKNSNVNEFFERFNIQANAGDIDDRLTTFSDFFAMSVPCEAEKLSKTQAQNIAILIYATFRQFRTLILNGFLSRGGITIGNVYHIDSDKRSNILFGTAFNDAYLLESQFANTPRVIISNTLRKLIIEYCDDIQNKDCQIGSFLTHYVQRASDGPAYVDMFADFYSEPRVERSDVIKIKNNLCRLLDEETDKPSVFGKILAISKLFNKAVERSSFEDKVELKISEKHLPL